MENKFGRKIEAIKAIVNNEEGFNFADVEQYMSEVVNMGATDVKKFYVVHDCMYFDRATAEAMDDGKSGVYETYGVVYEGEVLREGEPVNRFTGTLEEVREFMYEEY